MNILNIIKTIDSLHIPTTSHIKAIQHINERQDYTRKKYIEIISRLGGDTQTLSSDDDRVVKYTFLYLIQEIIKTSHVSETCDANELLSKSKSQAITFIDNNKYVFVDTAKNETTKNSKMYQVTEIYNDNHGIATREQMISMFMDELDITKASAKYYLNKVEQN